MLRHIHRILFFIVIAAVTANVAAQHAGHSMSAVNFPVSCSSKAQAEFNRAVMLLHHMTYPQARVTFQNVATIDQRCAMAHWGVAVTLFQPLWPTRPNADARQQGWHEVELAKSLPAPTQREQLFIAAAEAFFLDPAANDYWLRIRRWEQAMQKVYEAFPADSEAATFYALAHLATAPSDRITRANADRAAEILLEVYRKNPNHPGAMHYLVHANDVPGRERELLEITRKYERVAPNNPHAIHMPTHIYIRLGDWNSAIRGNLRAANAALQYPAGDKGQFVWDEFCHTIEYSVYAYLQQGNDRAAAAQIKRLRSTARLEPSFKTAFHLASTQARYALERRAWGEAAAIVPRHPASLDWDRFAWAEAIARFVRGLGMAHERKLDEAKAESERLDQLEAAMQKVGEDLFARNIRMLHLELDAWIDHVEGKQDASLALMQQAVALEESTPKHSVTPAPTLPARELLGDLLLEQNQSGPALAAYQRSLELYPKRFNSLLGAARAARSSGDAVSSRKYHVQLLQIARGGSRRIDF